MPSLALACRLSAVSRASRRPFSPASLFSSGEQGVWYDPSDFSTLFQDDAGTIPVTAVEQPVGLILDKSKGLVLGPELVANGTFDVDTTGWAGANLGTIAAVNGELELTNGGAAYGRAVSSVATVAGRTYAVSVTVRSSATHGVNFGAGTVIGKTNLVTVGGTHATNTTKTFAFVAAGATTYLTGTIATATAGLTAYFDNISVRELPGNHATQTTTTSRPVLSARVNLLTATETLATQTVTTRATTQTLRFEGAGTVTLSGTATGTYSAGSHSVTTTAGNLTLTVSGTVTKADLRATNMGVGLPAYQRVNTSTDYDTAGFPMYLRFDGVDDSLVTPSINFTATDKMTVLAGLRKLSDADAGLLFELSAERNTNNGTFSMSAPGGGGNQYVFGSRGTIDGALAVVSPYTYPTPHQAVLTGIGNISGDQSILRVNGVQAAQSVGDQGSGNFGTYPLYIGRRGGTSIPFNGSLYGLIVRGAATDDLHLTHAEKFLAYKSGVTL